MTTSAASGTALRHEALFYRDAEECTAVVGDFVSEALDAARPVLAVISGERAEGLAARLGQAWQDVEVVDMAALGRNPSRIIPAFRSFLEENEGGEVSVVGEPIWPGRSAAEIAEATRHEALINNALADTSVHALCPYQLDVLDAAVIADAYRTHPVVRVDGRREPSQSFTDPQLVWRSVAHLPTAAPHCRTVDFDMTRLSAVREAVRAEARVAGVSEGRADDLVVATSEVVGNSIRHGGGGGVLRTWLDAQGVVCEVRDRGEITDPLVGRRRPDAAAEGGWGLWLANQLCDLVQLHTDAAGTTVRLHMAR